MKGFNAVAKLAINNKKKSIQKAWLIYPGDTVEVIGGKDKGKRGEVLTTFKTMDRVLVDKVRTATKHVKPSSINGTGQKVTKPMPIHFSDLKLVDPILSKPSQVSLKREYNPKTERYEIQRYFHESKSFLPIPNPLEKKYEDYKAGPADTKEDLVKATTWRPSLAATPFPPSFLNQLEKFRRIGKEGAIF
ncbi:Plastid ribosomal protein L24 [Phlyctochytrium planicorne]|nr:Plastid ribosomal protein L24 [Phlyctochytrium planicorne]